MTSRRFVQTGATLIEVIIVTAIITIMTGFGLANYRGVQAQNELRDGAGVIKNAILETQALALGPRNVSASGIDKYFIQIEVGNPPDTPVQIKILEGYTDGSSTEIRKQVLPKPLSITIPVNQFSNSPPVITFSVLEQGKITSGLIGNTACLEVHSNRTASAKYITIIKTTVLVIINNGVCA